MHDNASPPSSSSCQGLPSSSFSAPACKLSPAAPSPSLTLSAESCCLGHEQAPLHVHGALAAACSFRSSSCFATAAPALNDQPAVCPPTLQDGEPSYH